MKLATFSLIVALASNANATPNCENNVEGFQLCGPEKLSYYTCSGGSPIEQPVAGGTKCCDDIFNLGKVYMQNEGMLCNDPCTFPDASIGQQICTDNPSKWIQCKYSGKDATDPTALDGKVMDVPDDTICCPHTVWEGFVVFKNVADGGC